MALARADGRRGAERGFWVCADQTRSADSIARAAAVVGVTPSQYRMLLRQIARAENEAVLDPDLQGLEEMGFKPAEATPLGPLSGRQLFDDVRRWTYRMHSKYSDPTQWSADVVAFAVEVYQRAGRNVSADLDLDDAKKIGARCAAWTWENLHR